MTFFAVDDNITSSEKWRLAGPHGQAMWTNAGSLCSKVNSDGVISMITARDAAHCAGVDFAATSARLVELRMWHDSKSVKKCPPCKERLGQAKRKLVDGEFYFHDWFEWQLSRREAKNPVDRRKFNRKKALHRNAALKDAIIGRDGTICRYCSIRVDFEDHRSDAGGTFDHVDPDGDNSLDNVVVACRGCNIYKGERTPEEAGMTLLDPPPKLRRVPNPILEHTENDSGWDPESRGAHTENVPTLTRAHTREGAGRNDSGNVPVSDPELRESGRADPGEVGSGEAGSGTGPGQADFPAETQSTGEPA